MILERLPFGARSLVCFCLCFSAVVAFRSHGASKVVMNLSDQEGTKAVLPAFYRKAKNKSYLGASKWSDMQKGRRQDYSTLKAPGFAKDLDPGLDDALATVTVTADAALLSLSESIGPMLVICPFDTTQLCESNKVCPTDHRPCQSSRHYWGHAVDASAEAKEGPGVGELGSALESNSSTFAMDLGDHFHSASSISTSSDCSPSTKQQPDECAPRGLANGSAKGLSPGNILKNLILVQQFILPLFMFFWKRDSK